MSLPSERLTVEVSSLVIAGTIALHFGRLMIKESASSLAGTMKLSSGRLLVALLFSNLSRNDGDYFSAFLGLAEIFP